MNPTRRPWLSTCLSRAAWPDVLSAQQHAHAASESPTPHFEVLDAGTAGEIEALATVLGFQGNPSYGGNRGEDGWHQIGFENLMTYQPRFGYYDAQVDEEKP